MCASGGEVENELRQTRSSTENSPRSMSKGEITVFGCSTTFGKAKKRFPADGLAHCKTERKHTSLRILPHKGARIVEQVYPYKVEESVIYYQLSLVRTNENIFHLKTVKIEGVDSYFKFKAARKTSKEHKKLRKHEITKDLSNPLVTKLNEVEIGDLNNKEFKIDILKKLNKLQENTKRQFNEIRKSAHERNLTKR